MKTNSPQPLPRASVLTPDTVVGSTVISSHSSGFEHGSWDARPTDRFGMKVFSTRPVSFTTAGTVQQVAPWRGASFEDAFQHAMLLTSAAKGSAAAVLRAPTGEYFVGTLGQDASTLSHPASAPNNAERGAWLTKCTEAWVLPERKASNQTSREAIRDLRAAEGLPGTVVDQFDPAAFVPAFSREQTTVKPAQAGVEALVTANGWFDLR